MTARPETRGADKVWVIDPADAGAEGQGSGDIFLGAAQK